MDDSNKSIEIAKLLSQIAMLLRQNMMKGFENTGITPPQGMVVSTLSRSGKMKISDISESINLSNSTVSGIIDRLEQNGLVERIRSEKDRRVVYVTLTDKFKEYHRDFHKKAEENIENIMKKGTNEEVEKVFEGLDILKRLLENK